MADSRMLAGQRRKWTPGAADNDSAVAFNMGQRSELLIHQLACCGSSGLQPFSDSFLSQQFASESFASATEQGLNLLCWQCFGEHPNEVGQYWNVRLRKQLLDIGCQSVDMRRSRSAWPFPNFTNDPISFHCRDLYANGTASQTQPGGDVIGRQAAGPKQRDDPRGSYRVTAVSAFPPYVVPPKQLLCWRAAAVPASLHVTWAAT